MLRISAVSSPWPRVLPRIANSCGMYGVLCSVGKLFISNWFYIKLHNDHAILLITENVCVLSWRRLANAASQKTGNTACRYDGHDLAISPVREKPLWRIYASWSFSMAITTCIKAGWLAAINGYRLEPSASNNPESKSAEVMRNYGSGKLFIALFCCYCNCCCCCWCCCCNKAAVRSCMWYYSIPYARAKMSFAMPCTAGPSALQTLDIHLKNENKSGLSLGVLSQI